MLSRVASFLSPTSTGSQAVTGLGFQPKCVIFFTQFAIDPAGNVTNNQFGIGVTTGASNEWALGSIGRDNQATSDSSRSFRSDACIHATSQTNSTVLQADTTSLDADGITINWTTVQPTQRRIYVLAMGGSEFSATAGTFNTGTSTGNLAVTGVGFLPKLVLFGSSISSTTDGNLSDLIVSIGAAVSSSSRFAIAVSSQDNQAAAVAKSKAVQTLCISKFTAAGAVDFEADFVSQDSDGFTINITDAAAASTKVGYLAMGGVANYAIGAETQKSGTGTKATTGIGFTPNTLILLHRNVVSSTSIDANLGIGIGARDRISGASAGRAATASTGIDAADPTNEQGYTDGTHLIIHVPTPGSISASATVSAFGGDGYTLNWDVADTTLRQHFHIAMGPATQTLSPSEIASAQAFGTAVITPGAVTVSPSGVASAQAFGTPQLNLTVSPTGIASAQAFGTPTVTPGTVTVSPGGIASAEAFGTPAVGSIVMPTGIVSGEAFGTPTVTPGTVTVSPSGVASTEAVGTPSVALNISPTGIASVQAFGTPTLSPGAVTLVPPSIASGETFGLSTVVPGAVTVSPSGIASAQALGTPTVSPGAVTVSPTAIASGQAFGTPTITTGAVTLSPSGIASAQAFGTPQLNLDIRPTGIASGQAFGTPTLNIFIVPSGIATAEAFGTLNLIFNQTVTATGIATAEAFGATEVIPDDLVRYTPFVAASVTSLGTGARVTSVGTTATVIGETGTIAVVTGETGTG